MYYLPKKSCKMLTCYFQAYQYECFDFKHSATAVLKFYLNAFPPKNVPVRKPKPSVKWPRRRSFAHEIPLKYSDPLTPTKHQHFPVLAYLWAKLTCIDHLTEIRTVFPFFPAYFIKNVLFPAKLSRGMFSCISFERGLVSWEQGQKGIYIHGIHVYGVSRTHELFKIQISFSYCSAGCPQINRYPLCLDVVEKLQ